MKREDFKEITTEHIKVCEKIIEVEGDCGILKVCDTCPFDTRNTHIFVPIDEYDKDDYDCEFYPEIAWCSINAFDYFGTDDMTYNKYTLTLAQQFIDMVNKLDATKDKIMIKEN